MERGDMGPEGLDQDVATKLEKMAAAPLPDRVKTVMALEASRATLEAELTANVEERRRLSARVDELVAQEAGCRNVLQSVCDSLAWLRDAPSMLLVMVTLLLPGLAWAQAKGAPPPPSAQCVQERAALKRSAEAQAKLASCVDGRDQLEPARQLRLEVELACDIGCARAAGSAAQWTITATACPKLGYGEVLKTANATEAAQCCGSRVERPPTEEQKRVVRADRVETGRPCVAHRLDGAYRWGHWRLDGARRWVCD